MIPVLFVVIGLFLSGWAVYRYLQSSSLPASPLGNTAANGSAPNFLISFASQTGFAEQLAQQTAQALKLAGIAVTLKPLHALNQATLGQYHHALFVVSTFGEGEPPDHARSFLKLMNESLTLPHIKFGVLALGDKQYEAFCGFGRTLDEWLQKQGAKPLFERVEVDNGDPAALDSWQKKLDAFTGISSPSLSASIATAEPPYERWRLVERRLLNPGSLGGPVFHLELQPIGATTTTWNSGDLVEIQIAPHAASNNKTPSPEAPLPTRRYSIASIPADGCLHLLIRQVQHNRSLGYKHKNETISTLGLGSGWLTHYADINSEVSLRIRSNNAFHLPAGDYPLILIGNGTGLAGLRSHLKARTTLGQKRNWLIFGERSVAHDYYYRDEIESWQQSGILERTDLVFSRDQSERLYVQDSIRSNAHYLENWINQGAIILMCGSLEGMAPAVENVLKEVMGEEPFQRFIEAGRYRRDVY